MSSWEIDQSAVKAVRDCDVKGAKNAELYLPVGLRL
jgi:hypothetical protein